MRLSIRIEVEKASMKAGRRRRPESQTKFKTKSIAKASRNLKIELRVVSPQRSYYFIVRILMSTRATRVPSTFKTIRSSRGKREDVPSFTKL